MAQKTTEERGVEMTKTNKKKGQVHTQPARRAEVEQRRKKFEAAMAPKIARLKLIDRAFRNTEHESNASQWDKLAALHELGTDMGMFGSFRKEPEKMDVEACIKAILVIASDSATATNKAASGLILDYYIGPGWREKAGLAMTGTA